MRSTLVAPVFALVLVVAAAACSKSAKPAAEPANTAPVATPAEGQSLADAMKIVCDAPNQCCNNEPAPADKATQLATYIDEKVTNAEVKDFFAKMGAEDPEARPKAFEEQLGKAGIAPADCAFYGIMTGK